MNKTTAQQIADNFLLAALQHQPNLIKSASTTEENGKEVALFISALRKSLIEKLEAQAQ